MYEREKQRQEGALETITSLGKVTKKKYPLGEGLVVDLQGATISDAVLASLKQLGRIAELNLSKSTLTDGHMDRINELEVGSLLTKLDVSHTGITDAGLDKFNSSLFLMELNLSGTKVTSEGIDRFRENRRNDPKIKPMFKSPTIKR